MPIHYINQMLGLPELQIQNIIFMEDSEIHFEASPVDYKQPCPMCESEHNVKRDGRNKLRKVRHLDVFAKRSYLHIPAIRLYCTHYHVSFVWSYDFVGFKQRYSKAFRNQTIEHAFGSTAAHSARMQKVPASTVQRMHQEALPREAKCLSKQAWDVALHTSNLIIGIDDFAIKKGHTYNTGIHDLRGGALLDVFPGRKLEALRSFSSQHPNFLKLKPKAVVMDLASYYHTWISECFPNAIRIADRFHVHGYVIEAVQQVRKSVQQTLSPKAKVILKSHHRLLNPPVDSLSDKSKAQLETLLAYSPLLRSVWEWKEAFTEWYDCSANVDLARLGLARWFEQGEKIDHEAVRSTLKTIRNWQEEIINYHRCRWTNATVEGRHNRIKAYQRRHYFTRNKECYRSGIIVECNRLRLSS